MKLAKHPVGIDLPHVTSHFRSVIELADIAGKVAPTSSCYTKKSESASATHCLTACTAACGMHWTITPSVPDLTRLQLS